MSFIRKTASAWLQMGNIPRWLSRQRTLARLAQAATRLQRGDLGMRMAEAGTAEARTVAHTFNSLAAEVQRLSVSLRTSQRHLAGQLAQTQRMHHALRQMSWQHRHDALTGLPNRAALMMRFRQALQAARRDATPLALCLVNLDHFQDLNNRHGAELADDVLRQVAERLQRHDQARHYAARLGGDEFVLLLAAQPQPGDALRSAAELLAHLAAPYHLAPHGGAARPPVTLTASAGLVLCCGDALSAETLLRHADQALYQAKLTGRATVHVFDAARDAAVRTHHHQRSAVAAALRDGQLRLPYQPKVDMRAGRVIGMEALLRWQHPTRGLLAPLHFLPAVDQSDLIVDIGVWVLRQALLQLRAWNAAGCDWVVSVNIAARQLQRADFVERLQGLLEEFPDVAPRLLELEILETSALGDIAHVRSIMAACQALGVSFALDDFGTGYSSLAYLKGLPANVLKIDQSFVRNMLADDDDLHLVAAVIGLAKSFRLSVIAEGVETAAQGAMLMQMGCDLAQGYGIARPMPADEVRPWAARFAPAPGWAAAAPATPVQVENSGRRAASQPP